MDRDKAQPKFRIIEIIEIKSAEDVLEHGIDHAKELKAALYADLAEMLNITESHFKRVAGMDINGSRFFNDSQLLKIAIKLKVTVDDLYSQAAIMAVKI